MKKLTTLLSSIAISTAVFSSFNSYSQVQDTSKSDGQYIIKDNDIKIELKTVPINYSRLNSKPREEIKNFPDYTKEDKQISAELLANYLTNTREVYEAELRDQKKMYEAGMDSVKKVLTKEISELKKENAELKPNKLTVSNEELKEENNILKEELKACEQNKPKK